MTLMCHLFVRSQPVPVDSCGFEVDLFTPHRSFQLGNKQFSKEKEEEVMRRQCLL